MEDAKTNIFHPVRKSALRQPRQPLALPDLENPFGDAANAAQSTNPTTVESSSWTAPTGTDSSPSFAAAQSTSTSSKHDEIRYQGLPKEAKIGIIVSIVVIVSLTLIGCGLCFLDIRRRRKAYIERRQNRNMEITMLEMQMRNRPTGQQHKRAHKGLWDHLKLDTSNAGISVAEVTSATSSQESPTSPMKPEPLLTRNDSTVESPDGRSIAGLSPTYIPRERTRNSIVSLLPSLRSSAGGRPPLPRSFLDGGTRR